MPSKTCRLDIRSQWVAALGAAKRFETWQLELGYRLGVAVARAGRGLITGATTGIPLSAAVGAKDHGGRVMGISPAENPREHTSHFGKPLEFHDTILYTGLGNDGRSPIIVRSAAIALFAGGEAGTLQEFAAAWLNGTPVIGILEKSGGISDQLRGIATSFNTSFGSRLLSASDPEVLVEQSLAVLTDLSQGASFPEDSVSEPTQQVLNALSELRKKDSVP